MNPEDRSSNRRDASTRRGKLQRPEPRKWTGVVPRRTMEKTNEDKQPPQEKVKRGKLQKPQNCDDTTP